MSIRTKTYVKVLNYVPVELDYFYIENRGDYEATLYLKSRSTSSYLYPQINLYYSYDKVNWYYANINRSYTNNSVASIGVGQKLYLKGNNINGWNYNSYYSRVADCEYAYSFAFDSQFAIGGNILSLLYNDNARSAYSFAGCGFPYLFGNHYNYTVTNSSLVDASDLTWGDMNSVYIDYRNTNEMFYNCGALNAITFPDCVSFSTSGIWNIASTGTIYVPTQRAADAIQQNSNFANWTFNVG